MTYARIHQPTSAVALVFAVLGTTGCKDDIGTRVDFEVEQAVFDYDLDTGDVELAPGALARIQTHAVAGYSVRAAGQTVNGRFSPIPDSGAFELDSTFSFDLSVDLDLPEGSFAGPLESIDVAYGVEIGRFDPFSIDQPLTLLAGIPAETELRAPVAGLPGATMVIELAGLGIIPTFEGVCLSRDGDAVQYTGLVKLEPDIRYLVSLEIAIPFSATRVIGPVGLDGDFPAEFVHPLDLGTFSVSSGAAIDGVLPCGEVDPAPPAITGTAMTAGSDDGGSDDGGSGDGGSGTSG